MPDTSGSIPALIMVDIYPETRLVHITAAIASGALFVLRGISVSRGSSWGMIAPIRYLSYLIDIVLLAAALMLLAILPSSVFSNGWLWVKLTLLVFYIGFGTLALRRARTATTRRACLLAAVAIYACMYFIARTHDPLGPLKSLLALLR